MHQFCYGFTGGKHAALIMSAIYFTHGIVTHDHTYRRGCNAIANHTQKKKKSKTESNQPESAIWISAVYLWWILKVRDVHIHLSPFFPGGSPVSSYNFLQLLIPHNNFRTEDILHFFLNALLISSSSSSSTFSGLEGKFRTRKPGKTFLVHVIDSCTMEWFRETNITKFRLIDGFIDWR